jgi:hypothetical protein
MNCSKCGAPVEAGHAACKYCGAAAGDASPPVAEATPQPFDEPHAPPPPVYNIDTRAERPTYTTTPRRSPVAVLAIVIAFAVALGVVASIAGDRGRSHHGHRGHHDGR